MTAVALADDPLADEIAKWKRFVETNQFTSEEWKSVRDGSIPYIEKAAKALAGGKRNVAVHYLAAVRSNLAGSKFVQEHHVTPETKLEQLEQEWNKANALISPRSPDLNNVPASFRAIAEASYSEIKTYYEASLEYGRNTTSEYGYFYLGLSRAQVDFVELLAKLKQTNAPRVPEFPGLSSAIDKLEDELLAAYKPPASIEHHPTFIRASSMIKHARELHNANLKFGALYRLLQARQVLSMVTDSGVTMTPDEINVRNREFQEKLQTGDHSIAGIFMERAAVEPEDGATASAIFNKVLPLYFSAMQSAPVSRAKQSSLATVTFVRWPYT